MAQSLTTADRIRDLNSINEEVASMLNSAGHAVHTLTGRAPPSDGGDVDMTTTASTVDSTNETFQRHVTNYYTSLQTVIARLRRQTYALEEAGIILPEAALTAINGPTKDPAAARATSASVVDSEMGRVTNGGLGNLDISWLNSRSNKVATEKENELMVQVETLLRREVERRDATRSQSTQDTG